MIVSQFVMMAVAIVPTPGRAAEPAAGLNHLYVVLDAPTFAAVRDSAFVAGTLAHADTGLPAFKPVDATATSVYLRGRTTYLELLGPANKFREPVGKVGVGLGCDTPAGFEAAADAWAKRPKVVRTTRTWKPPVGEPVPWYEVAYADQSAGTVADLWASVYRPEFLWWLHPARPADVRRRDYLLPVFDPAKLLDDVTAVELGLAEQNRAVVADGLAACGFTATAEGEFRGADVTIRLAPPSVAPRGLLAVGLQLTRPAENDETLAFGTTRLRLTAGGATARWEFVPADAPAPDVRRLLCGRWHQVEVELAADEAVVTPAGRQKLAVSVAAQVGVKKRIAAGELAVVTQLNADGTYTHEIVSADETKPFPTYREAGQWGYDAATRTARRTADTHPETTLGRATVTEVTPNALVLNARLNGGSAGITEVVRLRRFREPAAGR